MNSIASILGLVIVTAFAIAGAVAVTGAVSMVLTEAGIADIGLLLIGALAGYLITVYFGD